MQEERTPAIVLRTRSHGESDKIVTFLTRDWGKVTGIAKGAKRSRRRFVNVLEPFTQVLLRFRPARTNELAFIIGCDLLRSFQGPSQDLQRFAIASYIVELIDVMITGHEAGEEIYTLLLQGLAVLEEQGELSPLLVPAFELLLLSCTGYEPSLTSCHQCRTTVGENGGPWVFSPSRSGLLCARCRAQGGATMPLSTEALPLLSVPGASGLKDFLTTAVSARAYREVRTVASRLLSLHLPRPLKSVAFLEQAGLQSHNSIDAPQGE